MRLEAACGSGTPAQLGMLIREMRRRPALPLCLYGMCLEGVAGTNRWHLAPGYSMRFGICKIGRDCADRLRMASRHGLGVGMVTTSDRVVPTRVPTGFDVMNGRAEQTPPMILEYMSACTR